MEFRDASSLEIKMQMRRCVDASIPRRRLLAAKKDSPLGLGVERADVRPLHKVEDGEEKEQVVARWQLGRGVLAEPTSERFKRGSDVSYG